jgi:hypothetical protein
MLLIVILNGVLAVMIVSAIVALHMRAILTDRWHRVPRERRRQPRTPAYWPAQQPRAARASRRPVTSAG